MLNGKLHSRIVELRHALKNQNTLRSVFNDFAVSDGQIGSRGGSQNLHPQDL
jgi:hypothetical protein